MKQNSLFTLIAAVIISSVGLASGTTPSYTNIIAADAPVSFWPLNETSGTVIHDVVGTNNGTVVNGALGVAMGFPGIVYPTGVTTDTGVYFTNNAIGGGGYISIPYSTNLNTPKFSVEAWLDLPPFPATGAGANMNPLSFCNGGAAYGWTWNVAPANSSSAVISGWCGINGGWTSVSAGAPLPSKWTLYTMTYDGTTYAVYTNGVLAGSHASSYRMVNAGNALYLGTYNDGGTAPDNARFYRGGMENVAVYGYPLTPGQIANHYFYGTNSGIPLVASQPLSQTNYTTQTATFSVTVGGLPPLSYQWRAGVAGSGVYTNLIVNSQITAVTNTTLTIPALTTANAGDYLVVVTNAYGSATSQVARLTILTNTLPAIIVPPASVAYYAGQTANLYVGAIGVPPLYYQWLAGATGSGIYTNLAKSGPIASVTNSTLSISSFGPGNAADYRVVVTNVYGAVTSSVATLALLTNTASTAPIYGEAWLSNIHSNNADILPSGPPDADFVTTAINYDSKLDPTYGYTIGGFLHDPVFTNISANWTASGGTNASIITTFLLLTGQTYLSAGSNSFVVAHDDGVEVIFPALGGAVLNEPSPTVESFAPFNVTAPTNGMYAFIVQYTQCCAPPAVLIFDINGTPVENSSPPNVVCTNVTVVLGPDTGNCSTNVPASLLNSGSAPGVNGDTLTYMASPPGPYPIGTNQVTLWAVESDGLSNDCTAEVVVLYQRPPQLTCPADVTTNTAPGLCAAKNVALGTPVVTTSCPGVSIVLLTNNAPTQFPVGTNQVTWTATDNYGNTGSCVQLVIVGDAQPPVLSMPGPLVALCDSSAQPPYPDYGAFVSAGGLATDNCDINAASFALVSQTTNSGPPEIVTRTYGIADVYGNFTTGTQPVIISNPVPALAITRACPTTAPAPGQLMIFSGTVTNTGNVTLTNIVVNDTPPMSGFVLIWPSVPGTSYIVQGACSLQAPVNWTNLSASQKALDTQATYNIPSMGTVPCQLLRVMVDQGGSPGALVPFAITASMTQSGTPLASIARLEPGAGTVFTGQFLTPTNVCSVSDVLTATAISACGVAVSTSVTQTCAVAVTPNVGISVMAPANPPAPGQDFVFSGMVTNEGNVALTNVIISINQPADNTPVAAFAVLGVGQAAAFTGQFPAPGNTCAVTSTLTVTANSACGTGVNNTVTQTWPNASTPALAVTKTCPSPAPAPGTTLDFTGTVTNTGDIGLTNIVIVDSLPTNNAPVTVISQLAPGQGVGFSGSYLVPFTIQDTVTATATSLCGQAVTNTSTQTCPTVPACPECTPAYPFCSTNPLTSVTFNESQVLRAFSTNLLGPTDSIKLWYNDESAMLLGIRRVAVKRASGWTTNNYPVSALLHVPGAVTNPAVGTTVTTGDQAGLDLSGRPMFPALYITDTTFDPTSRAGDWQYGGMAIPPNEVFGAWKAAVKVVDHTVSPTTTTITPDADPARNNWNLGLGDPAPAGLTNQGYGAEARWDLASLNLTPGHTYRFYFMLHDGDQDNCGGDAGQGCVTLCACPADTLTLTAPVPDGQTLGLTRENSAALSSSGSTSRPVIGGGAVEAGNVRLSWLALAGRRYVVQQAATLDHFTDISAPIPGPAVGTAPDSFTEVGGATNQPGHYYRVRLMSSAGPP